MTVASGWFSRSLVAAGGRRPARPGDGRAPTNALGFSVFAVIAGGVMVAAVTGRVHLAVLGGLGLVVGGGLLLDVDLPWGGEVPLGHAVLIAFAVLLRPLEAAGVVAIGLVVVVIVRRAPGAVARAAASSGAAIGAVAAARTVAPAAMAVDTRAFLESVVAGVAFLSADLALHRRHLRQVLPLDVTLLCAAALLAIAYRHNPALSLAAAVPLLVTRYSFERFSSARRAYAQTTQALSLLPEVAGLTPLGHGERTAVYARALGEELAFDESTLVRVTTAARLHHIGYISLHEPEERTGAPDFDELGRLSGELLRETGFLADVAGLVEQAQAGGAAVRDLESAVVRVCSTLDDLAGDQPEGDATDAFAEVLRGHDRGLERTAAIALLRLQDQRPTIVDEARAASRTLALVAAAAAVHAGDEEPHDCR